jgi:hypothetical protein
MKRFFLPALFATVILSISSCNKTLNVNADWKDVTIVYGLLDQTEPIHYVKITKAFLGPGNALQFAQIPDSSNYSQYLNVTLNEYNGSTFLRTITLHDTLITNKDSGIFYFPVQKIYCTNAKLNAGLTYNLEIKDTVTRKTVEGSTTLISDFDIAKPISVAKASFDSGKNTEVIWTSAVGGKRYQVTVRIRYFETIGGNPNSTVLKSLDWIPLSDITSLNDKGGETMDYDIPGEGFYLFMGTHIKADSSITRALRDCDFIFTVGSEDLNTYIEVNEPSMTIIQEKPTFTDIINGIGLFTSRVNKGVDSLYFSDNTKTEIKTNQYTKDLGF